MSSKQHSFSSIMMDLNVRRDTARNVVIVHILPRIAKSWDVDSNDERAEFIRQARHQYGKGVTVEDRPPPEQGYDIVIPALGPSQTMDDLLQQVLESTERFAHEHQMVLDTGQHDQPDAEGAMVAKLKLRGQRKELWNQLRQDIDMVIKKEGVPDDDKVKYIMQFVKTYMQSRKGLGGQDRGGSAGPDL